MTYLGPSGKATVWMSSAAEAQADELGLSAEFLEAAQDELITTDSSGRVRLGDYAFFVTFDAALLVVTVKEIRMVGRNPYR